MAYKRMKPARPAGTSPGAEHFWADLRRAEQAIDQRRWQEAWDNLETLYRRFPTRMEPLDLALSLAADTKDMIRYQEIVERILKITPNDPEMNLAYAGVTLNNGQAALAVERFRRFVDRWPKHEEAAKTRETLAELEEQLAIMMDRAGLLGANRFELAARNDEIQSFMAQGRFKEAQSLARRLLDTNALYTPAINNLTVTYMLEGQLDQAISSAQRVLEFDPDNVHALANLAHSLHFLGRSEEAMLAAERMKASQAYAADKIAKIMETLSFLGDDAGLLEIYRRAQSDEDEDALEVPMPHHLAGAAAMRLGQEAEAQRYWQEALKLDPKFALARENLADLKLPVGQRNAPWAFSFGYWIHRDVLSGLSKLSEEAGEGAETARASDQLVQTLLQSRPYLETLTPLLLERGDPAGRQFAFILAKTAQTPALLTALRDFALSQNGTDEMRMDAANIVSQAGILDKGKVRLWMGGEWREIMLLDWEIYDEPNHTHSPEVADLAARAMEALQTRDSKRGEKLLMQALELEPNAPDLLNNLANAYILQKRNEEADILIAQIYEQFPDYFFGKVNMANILRSEGKLEEAEELLRPLIAEKRLHYSEFVALAQAEIELLLAKKEPEAARHWYDMWKQMLPDHPGIARYRLQFEAPELLKPGPLKRLFKRR